MAAAVPFVVLTGFLGAGKTTVLNRLLFGSQRHGRRVAVLVNELGRVAIDTELILSRGGDVLELAGGCVCCKIDVKNDLWDGVFDVIARSAPEHVVLETTGIAEPAAIIDGIAALPAKLRDRIRVAGVACVVDAHAGVAQLERRPEAIAQVRAADRILLSKLDLTPAPAVVELHPYLDALNAGAERVSFPFSADGDAALTAWLLEDCAGARRCARTPHVHDHRHGQVTAASFVDDAPLVGDLLVALVRELGDRLLRVKGFVNVAGHDRRGYLELAGRGEVTLTMGAAWGDEPRTSQLVFIGEDLDEAALRRRLWACRVGRD